MDMHVFSEALLFFLCFCSCCYFLRFIVKGHDLYMGELESCGSFVSLLTFCCARATSHEPRATSHEPRPCRFSLLLLLSQGCR